MTATTALTAQNTQGVVDIHHTPPQFVKKQIDACIDDIGVDVVKTGTTSRSEPHSASANCSQGMLASSETVHVVAEALQRYDVATSIVDPVCSPSIRLHLPPN